MNTAAHYSIEHELLNGGPENPDSELGIQPKNIDSELCGGNLETWLDRHYYPYLDKSDLLSALDIVTQTRKTITNIKISTKLRANYSSKKEEQDMYVNALAYALMQNFSKETLNDYKREILKKIS